MRLPDIALVLQDHVQGIPYQSIIELGGMEREQCPRPVECLADRRCLLQIELTQALHHSDELVGQALVDPGNLDVENAPLLLLRGEVDEEVKAPAF